MNKENLSLRADQLRQQSIFRHYISTFTEEMLKIGVQRTRSHKGGSVCNRTLNRLEPY